MEKKICNKCNIEKDIKNFYFRKKTNKFYNVCKICERESARIRGKRNYQKNKEKIKKRVQVWKNNNKQTVNAMERVYKKNKLKTNKLYGLSKRTRNLIGNSIKRFGYTKKSKTYKILGCSWEEFKLYLESKFESWMNWGNHGLYNGEECYGWDLDHITPIASAKSEEDLIRLNHYSNFQPLCSYKNRQIKKDSLDLGY